MSLFDTVGRFIVRVVKGKHALTRWESCAKAINQTPTLTTIALSGIAVMIRRFSFIQRMKIPRESTRYYRRTFLEPIALKFEQQYYDHQVNILQHSLEHKTGSENQAYRSYNFKSERYPYFTDYSSHATLLLHQFRQHIWRVILLCERHCGSVSGYSCNYKLTRNSLAFSLKGR